MTAVAIFWRLVLTVDGKPFGVAVGIHEDEIEETLDMLRRLRALRAMHRMQRNAEARGISDMAPEDVDEEVREARNSPRDLLDLLSNER